MYLVELALYTIVHITVTLVLYVYRVSAMHKSLPKSPSKKYAGFRQRFGLLCPPAQSKCRHRQISCSRMTRGQKEQLATMNSTTLHVCTYFIRACYVLMCHMYCVRSMVSPHTKIRKGILGYGGSPCM